MPLPNRAYKYLHILDTTPKSVFMYLETSESPNPSWGAILKSDAAGTAYVVSLDYVNENGRGRVDFTRLPLLQGIVLVNIVADPDDSSITGRKELTTVISRSDGTRSDNSSTFQPCSKLPLKVVLGDH